MTDRIGTFRDRNAIQNAPRPAILMRRGHFTINNLAILIVRVPEKLKHKCNINHDIVCSQYNLPSGLSCEQRPHEIARITQTPFHQEVNR